MVLLNNSVIHGFIAPLTVLYLLFLSTPVGDLRYSNS